MEPIISVQKAFNIIPIGKAPKMDVKSSTIKSLDRFLLEKYISLSMPRIPNGQF